MTIGFIGLGKMGSLFIEKLLRDSVNVVIYNRDNLKTDDFYAKHLEKQSLGNLTPSQNYTDFLSHLPGPRLIFLSVTAGKAVDKVIDNLLKVGLTRKDILVDLGNSYYKDSIKRYKKLHSLGIHFLDIGASGGVAVLENGASLMVGGEREIYKKVEPILTILSQPNGSFAYFGPGGAGHFVKMVHNGIEYGMLEAIGEGFSLLAASKEYVFDFQKIAGIWNKGSIIRGYLMELTERVFQKYRRLSDVEGTIGGGSTGQWASQTAKEVGVSVPVINASLQERVKSRKKPGFSGKVVALLRKEFGGHKVIAKGEEKKL